MTQTVLIKQEGPLLHISLNRPHCYNAMNSELIDALNEAMDQARREEVRVVKITGEGQGFCAGGDIAQFHQLIQSGTIPRSMPEHLHEMIMKIRTLPKPVVAVIHGPCAGAGFSLTLACDISIASDKATFSLAYTGIGLSPDGSSTFFLPRHVGMKKAMELFFNPALLSATQACNLGLINTVVPQAELEQTAKLWIQKLAQGPTKAYAAVKNLINQAYTNNLADQLDLETETICATVLTKDFQEGVRAFIDKEKPHFTGV